MGLVVQRIQELGVEVRHIPGGCTSLCQPVDVGFNKPFKDRMRKQWLSWMTTEGIIHGTTMLPSRRDVAGWVDRAMAEMKGEERIIENAWRKTGYEWFPKEVDEVITAAGGEIGGKIAAAVTMKEEEDEAIVDVMNECLEEELFSDNIGMMRTENDMEGDKEEIFAKEELPHYIAY